MSFNTFKLDDISMCEPLVQVGLRIFEEVRVTAAHCYAYATLHVVRHLLQHGMFDFLKIPQHVAISYFRRLETSYFENPYANSIAIALACYR